MCYYLPSARPWFQNSIANDGFQTFTQLYKFFSRGDGIDLWGNTIAITLQDSQKQDHAVYAFDLFPFNVENEN